MTPQLIVVTDLDGTLLHPATYSFAEAVPALELLKKRAIPIVFCSSKSRPEVELYRERAGVSDPFIVENGGAVFIPKGYFPFDAGGWKEDGYEVIRIGRRYGELREAFSRIRKGTGVEAVGFGDMTVEEVARLAGLSPAEAGLAKQREFDEPFIIKGRGEDAGVFLKAIEDAGLKWTKGRFYHILGDNDKGRAFRMLKGLYERASGPVTAIAIGDGFNDLPLLKEADYPVLVQKEDGSYEDTADLPGLIRAEGVGPSGWKNSILGLLSKW